MPMLPDLSDKQIEGKNILLVKVQGHLALFVIVWISKADMFLTSRQRWSSATGGNPMPLNTSDKTQFILTG